MRPVALTGGTGFIGRHLAARLREQGVPLRLLARRPPPNEDRVPGIAWVEGDLGDERALRRLVEGVDAVVHAAGLVAASDRRSFHEVNVAGTARLLAVLPDRARLVHVSSLAARAPRTSAYAASKLEAERLVRAARPDAVIVRPPAVYGPGDRATLPIFQQLARGLLVVPAAAGARFSLLFVEDLVELLASVATAATHASQVLEPDDGCPGGYGWGDLAALAAEARGAAVRFVRLPPAPLWPLAALFDAIARRRGATPLLGRDKLGELAHPDWVAAGVPGWRGRTDFRDGFAATIAWYRCRGWL